MKKAKNPLINYADMIPRDPRDEHSTNAELEKSQTHHIAEIIEYAGDSVVSKTILKKLTGNVTILSFAEGKGSPEKTSPFDYYIQVIDGTANVMINKKMYILRSGEGIIIPAHAPHCFSATEQFKILSTVIKSGYDN